MARKYELISELYNRTCKSVVSSSTNWQAFLSSACRNYKLRFDEQLLVFAQRPEATAVLEIERWNSTFGRWVNRGATGIAVFDDVSRNRQRLIYYFDISDTHESRYSRPVPIWSMKPEYEEEIINTLESTFGTIEDKRKLATAIFSAARNATEDNIPDYVGELLYSVKNSNLEDISEDMIGAIYSKIVTNSVAYMMMERLAIDTSEYFPAEAFEDIVNFNTPASLNALGFATSDIAEMGLTEIAKTIMSLDRQNRIIVENQNSEYNRVIENTTERSIEDERTDLYNDRGLQTSRFDSAGATGNNDWTLLTNESEVPERKSQGNVLQSSDELQAKRTSVGSGSESKRDDGTLNERDGRERRRNRVIESDGYDELGTNDEQHSVGIGGNRTERVDLPLIEGEPFTTKGVEYFYQDHEKCELIKNSPALKEHRIEIATYFRDHTDSKERGDYIMQFFNESPHELVLENGVIAGYQAYKNRLHLWRGEFANRERDCYEPWWKIAGSINGMLLMHTWDDSLFPTEQEQIERINAKNENKLYLPQDAIDYILTRGSSFSEGKYRIYTQFIKNEPADKNIAFLKNEYGQGGSSNAIPGTGYGEDHDAKGITISDHYVTDTKVLLSWSYINKRIKELVDLDRFLNTKEKGNYPAYLKKTKDTDKRWEISKEFREIIRDYNDFQEQLGNNEDKFNTYFLVECASAFGMGNKVTYSNKAKGDYILPAMRNAMSKIIAEKSYLTDRCEKVLELLQSDVAKPLEPTYDELNPPPEEPVEYQYHLGENVYLGANEYEILSFDDERVMLYDLQFPLINKEMPRVEFDKKVQENPMNDHLIVKKEDVKKEKTAAEQRPLAAKIVDFYKEYDFYDYQDNIESGATDEEVINIVENELSNDEKVILLTEMLEEMSKDDDLNTEQKDELKTIISELEEKIIPVAAESKEDVVPSWQNNKRKEQNFALHPEIPMSERHNFDLVNNEIEEVNKKERFHRNYAAITVLKRCQKENRFATPEEQMIMSKYVGWGGIPEVFDERANAWKNEYAMLKNILTPEEYESARESTLTAFYTPPMVIKAVYKAMEQMGFREGNILEPSCGIGHFIGMMPESMSKSKIYGVELDTISAGIAQQLYQKTSIAAQPFEEANLPDSFFDAVVGNVPFGDFKVLDKKYDKHKFLIHDYFFAKSLDKLRPGGVMALITSKGTMDKENPAVRKYIAQRADLLGAIRLPNNTFKGNAGTEVVSDILFLQKRDRLIDIEPDWVHLGTDANGIPMNSYFVEHPEMILGEMKMVSGRFGPEPSCVPYEGAELAEQLSEAIVNIHGEVIAYEVDDELTEEDNTISADPTVRNFSFTVVDGKIYFRENSRMAPVDVSATSENRVKGMIAIRDSVRNLIELQTEDYPDYEIKAEQERLNTLYDNFINKYGLLNSRANVTAFSQDSSYSLLSALEILDDEGNLERKADMFFKRTIKPHTPVTSVDTSSEALAVSMGEKACVDMEYMCQLSGKTEAEIYEDLKGVIFLNPMYGYGNSTEAKYLMADEYLSGNVREKLAWAKRSAELSPEDYKIHVEALEKVQPKNLTASEISVRLGATWLPPEIVEKFIFEFLGTPRYAQWNIKLHFSQYTGEWNIEGKSYDRGNVKAYNTYGTSRINAYKIIEETLNLKDVRIFDYIEEPDGKKKAVLNKKETAIAQSKQELIKQGFQDWIWADPERRERLCKLYNEKFNSIRPREYDGSHITFNGMNPEIELREHQKNAVAHILYGGNTLLAHAVGAGKTFEMTAAAMESKRLGLCNKSLFVVPNHLTEQWAAEFLQLYPSANVLVATKKDFETKNRKRFCGRIATGDYDAIIIGHSQFEKIPMSIERQRAILEEQLEEVTNGIADLKRNRGDNFSVKQLERTKKSVKQKLDKLNDQTRKDDVVTFEELGVDRLFIDESHYYKNLFLYTKMRNVAGIAQTEAIKSSDLFMKCRYLDEITGGRGTVFATGTPISNSMVELYTIQRYLQYNTLVKHNLQHFDAWASTFGETITAVELTPEGTGYRAKTRFARFYNLPELMSMFKEVADIKTADMLNLPVPKANFHNISVKPSEIQKQMVAELAERAEKVRSGMVDASIDNMLKITNDGRKLALDQRLINPLLPDFEGSKLNACVDAMFNTWEKGKEKRLTQLFFCDLSTPKNDGNFSVYDDIRKKLIERGVPDEEIKFIHEADTETKKLELFKKVRRGDVRILMGSTQKMGAGTNVQNKLAASSDLDCPWRPSDLEQRLGRSIRQGNENLEVDIFRFVTEETFDAYLYQLVEGKQKFASQIMTSKSPVRSCEDIDETALSYAEIKMLATGNPYIKEKMDLDIQVQKLRLLKSNYLSEKYALEDRILKFYPQEITKKSEIISKLQTDIEQVERHPKSVGNTFVGMQIMGVFYSEKANAGDAIIAACKAMKNPDPIHVGEYRGFKMELLFDSFSKEYKIKLKGELGYYVSLGTDNFGNITRIDNTLESLPKRLEINQQELENLITQFETATVDVEKPFEKEDELNSKTARLNELNALLNVDKRESEIVGGEPDEGDEEPTPKNKDRER